jgi:hypothetical protein
MHLLQKRIGLLISLALLSFVEGYAKPRLAKIVFRILRVKILP